MLISYTDTDITSTNEALDKLQETSGLPAFEFSRRLLEKAEEIARTEAARHKNAGRRLHEPDYVNMAETIAGIVDHTDPQMEFRGMTDTLRRLQDLTSKIHLMTGDAQRSITFSMGSKGSFHFRDDDFVVRIELRPRKQAEIFVNDESKGVFDNVAQAMKAAHLHYDADRFKRTTANLLELDFDLDPDPEDGIVCVSTPIGKYAIDHIDLEYEVTLDGEVLTTVDHLVSGVEFIKRDYVDRALRAA